ncbi:MAG TPA: YfhO family protein, partial [bacterium]|nr:YfhO family protein [bacterium]
GATLVTYRLANAFPWLSEATRDDLSKPSVTSDCTLSYYPRRVFATAMMRQGKIPFWNPHQFCGTPFFANFQSGVFYPINLAIYWLPPTTQMDIYIYVHFLIAAIFGYLLGRKLKLSVEGSLVSSLTFTFCGFMVTRYGQPTLVSTASWLPAIIYFGEHLVEAPSLRRAGLLALALSMCVLAGFPQLVLLAFYSGFLYIVLRVTTAGTLAGRRQGQTLALAGAAALVAILVCAFQLLPTYELSTFSYRKLLPYSMVLSSAHHKFAALKYLIPDILGDPQEMTAISKGLAAAEPGSFGQNYVSTTGYIGILPLLLAILALARPRRPLLPFMAMSGLALLAVFGTPLLRLFYAVLPGFNFSRIDRVVVVFMLGFSVLAGYGFDLARATNGKGRLLACGAGFMVMAAILALWLRNSGLAAILRHATGGISIADYLAYASGKILWFLVLAAAGGTLLVLKGLKWLSGRTFFLLALVIILADLLPNATKFKVSQPADRGLPPSTFVDNLVAEPGIWRLAKYGPDVLPSNTATIVGLDDIHGYDALNIKHYIEVLGAMDSSMTSLASAALRRRIGPIGNRDALQSPILDLLNVKYVLTVVWGGAEHPKTMAFTNDNYLPRAFLVGTSHVFATYAEMLAYMKTAEFDPRREVLLAGSSAAAGAGASEAAGASPGTAEVVGPDQSGLTVKVNAAASGYLVVSDVFYPGWRAFLDGREVPLLRADYAFRAVAVDAGPHVIKMTYKPLYFTLGLLFSAAGIALLAVMVSSTPRSAAVGGGQS